MADNREHPSFRARAHRRIGNAKAGDTLYAGAALANGVPAAAVVQLAGTARFRIRIAATAAGTLSLAFVRPDETDHFDDTDVYTTGNPPNVAVVANTEAKMDVAEHYGEAFAVVTFTPAADGAVDYVDICEV